MNTDKWKELIEKWHGQKLISTAEKSKIRELVKELDDLGMRQVVRKNLRNILNDDELAIIYLVLFMNPCEGLDELVKILSERYSFNKKDPENALRRKLAALEFNRMIRSYRQGSREYFYEPSTPLYYLIKYLRHNKVSAHFDRWHINSGKGLMLLFETDTNNDPEKKLLLYQVQQHDPPTRFDGKWIFPTLKVGRFEDPEIKNEFEEVWDLAKESKLIDGSFDKDEFDLEFKLFFPLKNTESNFEGKLYEITGKLKSMYEKIFQDVDFFNNVYNTPLKIEGYCCHSYEEWWSIKEKLYPRTLFHISKVLWEYYYKNGQSAKAKKIMHETAQIMGSEYDAIFDEKENKFLESMKNERKEMKKAETKQKQTKIPGEKL